jgi:hypothetical protein
LSSNLRIAMLRVSLTFMRAVRPRWDSHRITKVLHQAGLTDPKYDAGQEKFCRDLFIPLLSNHFVFENHQLTFLGDCLIDEYLSTIISTYFLDRHIVATVNSAMQFISVLHNHFTMRLFAEELGFVDLATPVELLDAAESAQSASDSLDFLVPQQHGPRVRDLSGTSFEYSPLRCGQSNLGWKFSHFIGALFMSFGQDAVTVVLDRMYEINGASNLPYHCVKLLSRTVDRYSAAGVAEAVLAAHGVVYHFSARTIFDCSQPPTPPLNSSGSEETNAKSTDTGASSDIAEHAVVKVDDFHPSQMLRGPEHLPDATDSIAWGPPLLRAAQRWSERTGLTPREVEDKVSGGWLNEEQQKRAKRGPAFWNFVDFPKGQYFADVYGAPEPEQGKVVARYRSKRNVRDEKFFDRNSDFRQGIPFETNGLSVKEYLSALQKAHERRFEVSLLVYQGSRENAKTIGKATGRRYTEAREAVCGAFLQAVLLDMKLISQQSS